MVWLLARLKLNDVGSVGAVRSLCDDRRSLGDEGLEGSSNEGPGAWLLGESSRGVNGGSLWFGVNDSMPR